ncbi:DUF6261 family protein [Parabacteroides sp. OttesenSCG-928-G07]|nr:DUF6261 family protein [Parabacteroides sp. OttesenSCG-928-G07]
MNKIKNLGIFHYLRNGEHFYLHRTLTTFLADKVTDFSALAPLFTNYKQLFDHEGIVFKHNARIVGTAEVKEADKMRDEAFRTLRMTTKALTTNTNLNNRKLAKELLLVIDNYKDAPQKAYNEGIAYIVNLIKDLRKPKNKTKVDALQLNELITSLETENNALETVYNERAEWLEAQQTIGNMARIRRPVDRAFKDVASAINSFYETNELGEKNDDTREKLENMIVGANAHIDNSWRAIAYRSPGHNKKPTPEPTPGPGPVEPFRFIAAKQIFLPGTVTMYIQASEFEEFDAAVDESILGAIINFQTEEDPNHFTVSALVSRDGETLKTGIELVPSDDQDLLGTFSDPEITVEAIKNEQVMLIIEGVRAPAGLA